MKYSDIDIVTTLISISYLLNTRREGAQLQHTLHSSNIETTVQKNNSQNILIQNAIRILLLVLKHQTNKKYAVDIYIVAI